MRRALAFVLLLASIVLTGCTSDDTRGPHEVYAQVGNTFEPRTLEVPVGTEVTWTSQDSVPHTVTSVDGLFDSGYLQMNGRFRYTFDDPGTYRYYCEPHAVERDGEWSGMVGTIVVTADNTTA